jgi:adenylate cyclase
VLDLVIDEVVKTLQAERGFIALWNENGAREFRSARGLHKTMIEQPEFEISRGVVEDVAKYGKVICISDAQSDDHFRKRPGFLDLSLRSILCAPLQLKDNILGVIYFDNRMIAGRIPATPVRGGQGEGGNSSALGELLCTFPPDKVVNSSCWGG